MEETTTAQGGPSANAQSISAAIAKAESKMQPAQPSPPRRKVGRPSKTELAAEAQRQAELEAAAAAPAVIEEVDTTQAVKMVVGMPFMIAAKRTGCDLIRLEADELEELGAAGELARRQIAPGFGQSTTSALALFSMALIGVSMGKWMMFEEWKIAKANEVKSTVADPAAPTTHDNPNLPPPGRLSG